MISMENKTKIIEEKKESTFQERLNELIQESGKSQKDLADYVGITRQSISLYAAGKRTPDIDVLKEICDYFNVSADYLLGIIDLKSSNIDNKEINKRLGLSDTTIELLEKDFKKYNSKSIVSAINFLVEQTKPLPVTYTQYETGETVIEYEGQTDVFGLINQYLKTKLNGTVRITEDGIYNRDSMSESEKANLSKFIASFPEDKFLDFFFLDRIKTELAKAKVNLYCENKEI